MSSTLAWIPRSIAPLFAGGFAASVVYTEKKSELDKKIEQQRRLIDLQNHLLQDLGPLTGLPAAHIYTLKQLAKDLGSHSDR